MAAAAELATAENSFKEFAFSLGLTQADWDYLQKKGFRNEAIVARAHKSEEEWECKIIEPHIEAIKETDARDPDIITAVFRILREECLANRMADIAKKSHDTGTSSQAEASTPASSGGPSAAAPVQVKRKIHELETGDWQAGLDRWENQFTPRKKFDQKQLLGAEATLARPKYEQLISREYKPIGLAEVWSQRTFFIDGTVNMSRVRMSKEDIEATATDKAPTYDFTLKDPLSVQDALKANMWALRWANMASEDVSLTWAESMLLHYRNPRLAGRGFPKFYWMHHVAHRTTDAGRSHLRRRRNGTDERR